MYNKKMKEITRQLSDKSFSAEIDIHEHNNVSYIHCVKINLHALGSAQKGYLRLAWNNIDGCIDHSENMDITCIIVVYDNNRELRSFIQIEDMQYDILNIKDQIQEINPMYIYDDKGNEIWNYFE